ncbi:MAG: hypothetical protein GEU90_10200 [Gemmatimonas sp.]|nr:hypothetical protein [Gemmatimonas sp.]
MLRHRLDRAGFPRAALLVVLGMASCDADVPNLESSLEATQPAPSSDAATVPPAYIRDPAWPPALPNGWSWGVVTSVATGPDDHVWVLHRPRTAEVDNPAPPVLEFDANGAFIQAWGGPGDGYDWPDTEHGIFVDHEGNVWVNGINPEAGADVSDRSDDMLLKFTSNGTLLFQLGGYDVSSGNADTQNPRRAADVAVYPATGEAFVADGYGNNRVWVISAENGEYRRMWGAFGNEPIDDPELPDPAAEGDGPDHFDIVHGLAISNDGLVYVADRSFRRIQVFTVDGRYQKQGFVARDEAPRPTVSRVAFSADPQQRYLFASDFGGGIVWILDRESLQTVGRFGSRGTELGQFGHLHHLAVDSRNNVYTAEVGAIGRVQKFRVDGN